MPNNIKLSQNYIPLLDEVYKKASTTTVFDADDTVVRQGANANEILVAKLEMSGLKDYSRNEGYKNGSVNLVWETLKYNYDRGVKFTVDSMDNEETIELSFGKLGGEFERTKVAPEGDAFFYSTLAGTPGISKVSAGATYTTGEQVLEALRAAQNQMDEDEVSNETRHLRITPTLLRMAESVDKHKDKSVLDEFASIEKVPQSRFYTAIELDSSEDEEDSLKGGYKKADGGKNINFMIIEKSAVIKKDKHKANDIIRPEDNQTSDGYMQKYRKYGIVDTYENKLAGIYLSHQA